MNTQILQFLKKRIFCVFPKKDSEQKNTIKNEDMISLKEMCWQPSAQYLSN